MAQTELEQIARAMMILAEDPERRRNSPNIHPMSMSTTTVAVSSSSEECETKDGPTTTASSSISSIEGNHTQKDEDEEESEMDRESMEEKNGETEEFEEMLPNYSINPRTPTPTASPAGSLKSNESGSGSSTGTGGVGGGSGGTGSCGGANSVRRIFTPEFKARVLEAFTYDPDCIGNQRATARKFNIHRRQVQKWLQQQATGHCSDSKDQPSSDEQEQKVKQSDNREADFIPNPPSSSSISHSSTAVPLPNRNIVAGGRKNTKSNKSRSNRSQAAKKMPIVAGKGPSIPQASAVSSSPSANLPSSSPLMNLGKGFGNIHHPLFSTNSFIGLSSPLLSLPLALEASNHSRHSSPPPRQSPPNGMNGNGGSPVNGNHHPLSPTAHRMLELVDELSYLYPSEDFSLLRKAMLKNEVTFTKLSPPPLRRHNTNSRKNVSSPVPAANDYITQQTLQMIKNQNEYLQLWQSGYANLSHFQDVSEHGGGNGKYASWLNPFAAAAAAGYNVQHGFNNKQGNGLDGGNRKRGNGNNNGNNNGNESSSHHNFASPKAPVSNPKSKTVAAVLAANRNGPTRMSNSNSLPSEKAKRPTQNRRKMVNGGGRPMKSFPSPPNNIDEDYLDPTSMLEVVTSKPSPIDGISMESYGMDLSTTSVIQRSPSLNPSSTLRSKAMNKDYGNKDYGFLSELGLVRKEDQERESTPEHYGHGQTSPPVSSLEHFVDNVLSLRRSSPQTSSSSSPGLDSNPNNTNNHHDQPTDRSAKDSVLSSYNFDPEVSGDARAVARKFGLNIRVVQKWIREAPTRSIPSLQYNGGGGHGGVNGDDDAELEGNENILHQQQQQYRSVIASTSSAALINPNYNGPTTTTTTVNKRKNPKPNQICDFTQDDLDENVALDMVVPIKKRRLSTPTPTSA